MSDPSSCAITSAAQQVPIRLEDLALHLVAQELSRQILDIASKYYFNQGNAVRTFAEIKSHIKMRTADVPVTMWEPLVLAMQRISHHAAFYMYYALADIFKSIELRCETGHLRPAVAPSELTHFVSSLPEGLTSLSLDHLCVTDAVLIALSESKAAPSLEKLSLKHSVVSSASSHCWARFPNITSLCLNSSYLMDSDCARSIAAAMPRLSVLDMESPYLSAEDSLNVLLGKQANLPFLAEFAITDKSPDSETTISHLTALLRERPPEWNAALTRIEIISNDDYTVSNSVLLDIHSLCPNLHDLFRLSSGAVSDSALLPIFASAPNLRHLLCGYTLTVSISDDIMRIAQSFPKLEELVIVRHVDNLNLVEWSTFQNLTKLHICTYDLPIIRAWPPQLAVFSFECYQFIGTREMHEQSLTPFINSVATNMPGLNSLELSFSDCGPVLKTHLQLLLSSMLQLEKLSLRDLIVDAGDGNNVDLLPVNHPNLRSVPQISILNVCAYPGWLPKCSMLHENNGPEWIKHISNIKHNIPNLQHLIMSYNSKTPEETAVIEQLAIERILRPLLSTPGGELTLLNIPQCGEKALEILPSFSNLSCLSLQLNMPSVAPRGLACLLAGLPWLVDLALNFSSVTDLSWLKHNRLSSVTLSIESSEPDDFPLGLQVCASTLPQLLDLQLFLHRMCKMRVFVFDLPTLSSFVIRGGQLELCVNDCPILARISIMHTNLFQLSIYDLFNLREVLINGCARSYSSQAAKCNNLPKLQRLVVPSTSDSGFRDDFPFFPSQMY